jgi:tetratricopeptide (TPR) repeat protein
MRLRLNGPFRVYDDLDRDITPKGIKERGLLALLALSPGQRRTRAWLQDKLWSERSPEQASGSCRQALSNMRKALGPLGARVQSDRSAIWLEPAIPLQDAFDAAMGEVLDDIDIADPEFVDWLRELRMQHEVPPPGTVQPLLSVPVAQRPVRRAMALISRIDRSGTARGAFILRALSQRIVTGLALLGDLEIVEVDVSEKLISEDQPAVRVELECLDDSDMAFVLLRVLSTANRRIVWSGRVSLAPSVAEIWASADVTRAVNCTVQAVSDAAATAPGLTAISAINHAVRRVFEFEKTGLVKADGLLRDAGDGEARALALAWRGFLRLTEALEFRDADSGKMEEAMLYTQEALALAPEHPVVLSLASQVTLRATGNLDQAHYLAGRAVSSGEDNPYALDALSQTLIIQGRYDEAHKLAEFARLNAQGLPHSFSWDLLACFTALGIGDKDRAYDLALTCHRKMPFYRPALRYLTAISALNNRPEDIGRHAQQLRKIEPDFTPALLLNPTYPVETLRDLGLIDEIRARLV